VAVRNQTDQKLYLYLDGSQNAAPVDALETSGADIASSGNCHLGRLNGNFWFDGFMDEARIYSKALTAEGVLHHYTNPTATDNPSTQDSDNHTAVPAMTVWGLAATAAVLGLLAMVILRRRMVVRSDR
jgi:hypothetical protein